MTDSAEPPERTWTDELGVVAGLTPAWSSVIGHASELSEARRDITSSLDGSPWPAETVEDLLLATSELVVNAMSHGDARTVDVRVGISEDSNELVVVICHVDRWPVELADPPTMPPPGALQGRGRAIVAAVADRFETVVQSDNSVVHVVAFAS